MSNTESNKLQVYLRLLSYLKPLKWQFAISVIGFAIFAASQPLLAKFFELVITAIESKDQQARILLPLAAIGIFLVRGFGSFLGNYFNDFVGSKVVKTLKETIFLKLTYLPAEFFDNNQQGQLLHQLNHATELVKLTVTNALKTLISEGLTLIFLLLYAFWLNWQLSLTFLIVAPLLAIIVSYASKKFRSVAKKNEDALGQVMQVSKEMISNYNVVRAHGAQQYESKRYNEALLKAFKNQMKISRIAAILAPFSQLIVASAIAFIVYLILSPESLAKNTTAELIGYLTAIALIPKALRQLSGVNVVIQQGIVGAEIVFNLIDAEPEYDKGTYQVKTVKGEINIENLSFQYASSEKPILNNINLSVKKGEMIALVGESGSGKSTLASLLTRTYRVPEKTIYIDGIDINDYKLDNLRQHVSLVDQNISLFDDTIKNNIAYGDTEYSDEEILEAMRMAHAIDFIEGQKEGVHTMIGENGLTLSGGQRQRLSIARAFLKKSPILILDEATSALDNESESYIKRATQELAQEKTTIIIAHRLSTIEQADRLLVMKDGEIIEQGTHKELLALNGYYTKLFNSEFQS